MYTFTFYALFSFNHKKVTSCWVKRKKNLHTFPGIYFKGKTLVMASMEGKHTYTSLTVYWQTFPFFFEDLKGKIMWKTLCPFSNQESTVNQVFLPQLKANAPQVYPSCFTYAPTSFHQFSRKRNKSYFYFWFIKQRESRVDSGRGYINFLPTLLTFCINKK